MKQVYWAYARVSTIGQSDSSISVQLEYLRGHASRLGLEYKPFFEKMSGSSLAPRTELNKIIKQAKEGDYVGVYDSSRLGRNIIDSLLVVDDLIKRGVKVQIGDRVLDEKSPSDELMFTIESAFAQFQLREQKRKSLIGIEDKKKNGDWLFTGRLLGYDIVKEGSRIVVKINESEAVIIRYIYEEYANGKSINQITNELVSKGFRTKDGSKFVTATVRRYIHKPIYKGYYKIERSGPGVGQEKIALQDSTLVRSNYYMPIVSEELWDRVNFSYRHIKRAHSIQFPYKYAQFELSSIIKCYYCKQLGKATGYVHSYHKQPRYNIANSNYINRVHLKGCEQSRQTFRAAVFESLFRSCFYLLFANENELTDFLSQQKTISQAIDKEVQEDINRLNDAIRSIENKENHIIKAIIEYGIEDDRLARQLEELRKDKARLSEERAVKSVQVNESDEVFNKLREEYSETSLLTFMHAELPSIRRDYYIRFLKHVYVYRGKLTILFKSSKVFIIQLLPNHGRRIQHEFKIKVGYKGRLQYCVSIDTTSEEVNLLSVANRIVIKNDRDRSFYEANLLNTKRMLFDLQLKLEQLRHFS